MKSTPQTAKYSSDKLSSVALLCLLVFLFLSNLTAMAEDEPTLADKAKARANETKEAITEAAQDTKKAAVGAGQATAESFENLWRRVDESRIKNRSRDEIVAWVIMGALVSAVAGALTSLKNSGLGKVGRLLLGLGGALIGGMVVRVAQINFGWGPVLIRYEDLLFSLLGAIVLIFVGRLLRSSSKKPSDK